MRKLEDKCGYWEIARHQRKVENDNELGNEGTFGFEIRGCYMCDGYFSECPSYFTIKYLNKLIDSSKS